VLRTSFANWIKGNKIAALVILFLLFVVSYQVLSGLTGLQYGTGYMPGLGGVAEEDTTGALPKAETSTTQERLVVEESNLSLVVKDVSQTAEEVASYAGKEGGFMVSSSITRPEESPVATVVVRVPSAKLKAVVEYFRSLAIKVSSENLRGRDVTETYADYEARIKILEATISQFEAIKEKATEISDLVSITQKIITLQEQIDSYKGLKKSLADKAAYSKITAYLATDEFALPYQPPAGFRPSVVFKQAVRSLLANLYVAGKALIWIGVYSVIWVPALALVIFLRRRRKRSSRRSS